MNVNGLKHTLGKKAGPLPIGVWVAIGLIGFMVARYLRSRNAAASQDVNANLTDQTPSDAASLGALDPGYDDGSGNTDAGTGGDSGGGVGGSIAPSGNVDNGAGGNVGPTAPAASTTPAPVAPASPDAPADSGHPQVSATVVDKAVAVVVKGLKFGTKAAQKEGVSSTTAGRDSTRTTTGHAPELVSEHGRGGGFQPHPTPAAKSTSKAVRSVQGIRDGGPSSPAGSLPAMMAVAAPSGHSPALAPSAAPSTVGVATTTQQYHHSGHKEETDG